MDNENIKEIQKNPRVLRTICATILRKNQSFERTNPFKWKKEEEAFQKVKDAYHDNQVLVLHDPRSKYGFMQTPPTMR